ncbi:MAG: MarR family transcriptional regulator [Rickettsiales bacterium]|jgi:DNA-binding MarR family transcriptional regulator|nr:MarR family transcriptional regulator [Rickettsiales bacterium]
MPRKEFVRLMEENILILSRLADKIKFNLASAHAYPRQQLAVLVRLHICGRAKLKDIACREAVSAASLCAMFRKLEKDGLVSRDTDKEDRRNTWYSITPKGAEFAGKAMESFREYIEALFGDVSREDEAKLTQSLRNINKILKNMEN